MKFPIAELIEKRLLELGLDAQALGLRLGYKNPAKAAGRVYAICSGYLDNRKSRSALARLADAVGLPAEVVDQVVLDTRLVIAEKRRVVRERAKAEREANEAEWRKQFRPHAVILTERRIPDQIVICGLLGGAGAYLIIPFDLSRPSATFVNQAVAGLKRKTPVVSISRRYVPFFGAPTGIVINYSPDLALHCDLDGHPIQWLSAAYRIGQIELTVGSRVQDPKTMARLLHLTGANVPLLHEQ